MIEQSVSLASSGVVKVPGYEQLVRFGYTKNRGVYRLHVDTTGEWEGLTIRCFWHVPDGKDPASSLVVDGYVAVPASVTAQPGSGCVTFEGSDGTKTVTSADLRYRVSANSGTEDGTMPEPGTPAWQQLVDAVHTDATAAEQAKTDAQTAAQQAGASAQKAGQALSDTITAKEDALKAIGDKQTTATQAVDTARDKALKQVEASTKAAKTAASEAATSAGNADQSAQKAAGSLQALKDGIAAGDFKGEPGNDGKSPIVTVTDIENGHRVSITDKDGTKTIDVLNGQTGKTGATPVMTIGTVSSGDKPSADITGTPENPVLNLRLQPGPQGPAVALDPTLSLSGKAADAAKVGEAVGQVNEDIDNIKKKKNVVIYVGSSELSDEQKLSCDYICDGVDDQIEINQAIDSLPDSGGEIHLSRGIFNISNSITIRKRIKLVGEGKGITLDRNNVNNGGTTLLSELTGGAIILITKSDTLSDIKGITLSDFQIIGAGINVENNYCNGINVETYTDCVTLERLAICHCFYGVFADQSATVDDISVTNCDFQRDTTGIYIYGQGWQTRIENNIFWDMSGRQATSGIVLSAGKNIVSGNYFGVSSLVSQDRTVAWISAKNAVSLLCNGNSFSRCTSSPIRFEAGGQFASINGNSFSDIGKAQFQSNERAVLYVDGAGTGGGRISFTNNTVFWANGDDWKTSYLAYLTNQVAQVNISNNTVIDGIGKITEDELVYKSEDSAYAITIGNNVLC